MSIFVLWVVMPCGLWVDANVSVKYPCQYPALKMETVCFSESSIST
jgi:hypothetical protein